jgi:hypothetical protein
MKSPKIVITALAIGLILGATGWLLYYKENQRLGDPGIKSRSLADTRRVEILLPDRVLNYQGHEMKVTEEELRVLPDDTSFGKRRYVAPDGRFTDMTIVLMGTDRLSIHQPQNCLPAQGWNIDKTEQETIWIERPHRYALPVNKLTSSKIMEIEGREQEVRAIFVYWFVADGFITGKKWDRMWWQAKWLLKTGELQRWAYVSYMGFCLPGQEDATYERMRRLIKASVPEFQTTTGERLSAARADGLRVSEE